MTDEEKKWLKEYLKTAKNQVETALLIIECNRKELLYTALESLYETTQLILDDYCIVEEI